MKNYLNAAVRAGCLQHWYNLHSKLPHQQALTHAKYTSLKGPHTLPPSPHAHTHTQWAIVSERVQASGEQKPSVVTSDLWWLRVLDWHEGLWETFRWFRVLSDDCSILKDHCKQCLQGFLCLHIISWLSVISDEQQNRYRRLFWHTTLKKQTRGFL